MMAGATRLASSIGPRGTKKTPSVNSETDSAASCRLKRVLPVPPGPVSVSSRVVASRRLASATSRARPTKLVSWVGRLFGVASRERSAGN